MIIFNQVTKSYRTRQGRKTVLETVSCKFESGHNFGILGGNGAGKSTLIRLIAGGIYPDSGAIRRRARVSFPLGFTGTFHSHLTGLENITFLARVYGENVRRLVEFVGDFSELGAYLAMPLSTYSAGMVAKLAFGISLGIDFDVYLIDEVTEVGDARFRQKSLEFFRERMSKSDIIMVSHNSHTIQTYCDRGAVLANGHLIFYDSVGEAMRAHRREMGTEHA